MSSARAPKSRRVSGRAGRRPAGRPGGPGSGRSGGRPPGRTTRDGAREPGRDAPGGAAGGRAPVPFERGRAALILGGLLGFTGGFAVAGVLVAFGQSFKPPYMIALTIGLMGLGAVGFGMSRGTTPMPVTPIWSRATLRLLASAATLPPTPVICVLYALGLIGVAGNVGVPLIIGG